MNERAPTLEPLTEAQLLRQIERMEEGRDMFLQLLRENPEIVRFQDARTLENFGIGLPLRRVGNWLPKPEGGGIGDL